MNRLEKNTKANFADISSLTEVYTYSGMADIQVNHISKLLSIASHYAMKTSINNNRPYFISKTHQLKEYKNAKQSKLPSNNSVIIYRRFITNLKISSHTF